MKWAIQRELADRIRRLRTAETKKQQQSKEADYMREIPPPNSGSDQFWRSERPTERAVLGATGTGQCDSTAPSISYDGVFCATADTVTTTSAADTSNMPFRPHPGGAVERSSIRAPIRRSRTADNWDVLAEHARQRDAFNAAALAVAGTSATNGTTAETLAGKLPKCQPVHRSGANINIDLRDAKKWRDFCNGAIAATSAVAKAADISSKHQSSVLRRTVSSGGALHEVSNILRSTRQVPVAGISAPPLSPSWEWPSCSPRSHGAASSENPPRYIPTSLHPSNAAQQPYSAAAFAAGDTARSTSPPSMRRAAVPTSPPSMRKCVRRSKSASATPPCPSRHGCMSLHPSNAEQQPRSAAAFAAGDPARPTSPPSMRRAGVRRSKSASAAPPNASKDAAALRICIDAPESTESDTSWLSTPSRTSQAGGRETKDNSPGGAANSQGMSKWPRVRESKSDRQHGTTVGESRGPTASEARPRPRPESLGFRALSRSSAWFHEALRVQAEIDQATADEEKEAKINRRRDRKGVKEDSTVHASGGSTSYGQRQQRAFLGSTSSEEEGENESRAGDEEEKGARAGWQSVQASVAVTTASSTACRGEMTVSTKADKEEEGVLRRSLSLGSAPLPAPAERNDGDGLGESRHHQKQNSAKRERINVRAGDEAAWQERGRCVDIRAGRPDLSSLVDMSATLSAPTQSRGRSQGSSRAVEMRRRRVHIEREPVTPAKRSAEEVILGGAEAAAAGVVEAKAGSAATERALMLFTDEPSPSASASPSVWVVQHLDCSDTYGLVFLMSDESVGLLFRDGSKMAIDPAGRWFDYIEPRLSSTAAVAGSSPTSSIHEAESGAGGRGKKASKRCRYSVDYFPYFLRKKVGILRYFRENVLLVSARSGVSDGGLGRRETSAGWVTPGQVTTRVAGAGMVIPSSRSARKSRGGSQRKPLTVIEKWQSVGDTHCFQLSDQTLQVRFSDGTEILLSGYIRSVTFVAEGGNRETLSRQEAERRKNVMKRVRCAEDFMYLMVGSA